MGARKTNADTLRDPQVDPKHRSITKEACQLDELSQLAQLKLFVRA